MTHSCCRGRISFFFADAVHFFGAWRFFFFRFIFTGPIRRESLC